MAVQIQHRRGTAAAWTSANTVLADGEFGFETDTTYYKVGDGTTAWTSLAYSAYNGIIGTGAVTSAMILDDTIVNADIKTSAAIAQSKIANLTSDLALKAALSGPDFTGVPTVPTATVGTSTTQAASTAFVAAEVAALVDASPAALNTLNELALALGSDAAFSTTVTNSLALKAPLASPALTGVPAAPTASAGTSTTQLATTAFVTTAERNTLIKIYMEV